MYYIITYDIAKPKRLVKTLKLLRQYLFWMQNSVFEGELTEKKFAELKMNLKKIIKKDEDSVIFYKIRTKSVVSRSILGITKNDDIYIL